MASTSMKPYENISLKPVENGFILCYSYRYKPEGKGEMCSMEYSYKEEVFTSDQKYKAVDRMTELHKASY